MYYVDPNALARVHVEDRLREARSIHLARELRRREQPTTVETAVRAPRRRPRLSRLVHLRHALG